MYEYHQIGIESVCVGEFNYFLPYPALRAASRSSLWWL